MQVNLDEVFDDLLCMDAESFQTMLDEHEVGEVGLILNEIWGFAEEISDAS